MTLQAVPVTIEDGMVRSMDGSTLPRRAHAVLVILPDSSSDQTQGAWQLPFDEYFALVQSQQFAGLEDVSDEELNALIHAARQIS